MRNVFFKLCRSISLPEMGHFESVFNQIATDPEMPGYACGGFSFQHGSTQGGKRYQSGGSNGIGSFLIHLSVVPSKGLAVFSIGNDCQPVRFVAQKDVANLLHQGSVSSGGSVIRVKYHYFSAIR